jgi:hypothetical protein
MELKVVRLAEPGSWLTGLIPSAVFAATGENAGSPPDGPPSKLCAALDMSRDCAWTEAGLILLPRQTQFLASLPLCGFFASIRFSAPAETRAAVP